HEEQKKKLIAGIVVTGGGAQLKHLKQLVEYITGMDTRIGYPNEHLAGNTDAEVKEPLFATAVGLVLNSLERKEKERNEKERNEKNSHNATDRKNRAKIKGESLADDQGQKPEKSDDKDRPHTIETAEDQNDTKPYRKNIFD